MGHVTRTHRLTPVQKKILRWMYESGGTVAMVTGHKQTTMLESDGTVVDVDNVILCQSTVQYFLRHHGYIQFVAGRGPNIWTLTPKGSQAAHLASRGNR